jgi:SAM-dependent methyltransferase
MAAEQKPDRWQILQTANAFRAGCVLGAAAELDLFSALGDQGTSAEETARRLQADLRATTTLLDALAALEFLDKQAGLYAVPEALRPLLVEGSPQTLLPMLRHATNLVRTWSQLAQVVKTGQPAAREPSIRGAQADRAAFVAAMHTISGPIADDLVARLGPWNFRHLLDVGGASGTWTLAFLRAVPDCQATIFDLPDAIEQARQRMAASGLGHRVRLVAGDFYSDDLPGGADLAWVSAIAHQHSRADNRALFEKIRTALVPGGRILIRDVVMDAGHVRPVEGALFAINMLVNTAAGGTFTFDEYAEDLQAAGFRQPRLRIKDPWMNSVVEAGKPKEP